MDTGIDMIRQKSLLNVDGGVGGGVGEKKEKSSSPSTLVINNGWSLTFKKS